MKADTGKIALLGVGALLVYGIYSRQQKKPTVATPALPPGTPPPRTVGYTINWSTPTSQGVRISIFGGVVPPGTTVDTLLREGWTLEGNRLYEPEGKVYLDVLPPTSGEGGGIPGTVMTATATSTKSTLQTLNAAAAPYPTKYYEKAGATPLVGIDIY